MLKLIKLCHVYGSDNVVKVNDVIFFLCTLSNVVMLMEYYVSEVGSIKLLCPVTKNISVLTYPPE